MMKPHSVSSLSWSVLDFRSGFQQCGTSHMELFTVLSSAEICIALLTKERMFLNSERIE